MAQTSNMYRTWHKLVIFTVQGTNNIYCTWHKQYLLYMAQICNIYHTWHKLVICTIHGTNLYSVECHMCTLEECNRTSFISPQSYFQHVLVGSWLLSQNDIYTTHQISAGCTFVLHMCQHCDIL